MSDTVDHKITSLESLGPFLSAQDNAKNFVYASEVPAICKDEPCMLGVDEAGRGPVLGPMVYGIAYCPLSKTEHLKTLGCADSKQLTEEKRELIFDDITTKEYCQESIGWCVDVISPNTISNCMLRRTKCSLNEVSMQSAIGLIHKAIELGANIKEVYVDTVGPPEKYQEKLCKIFPGIDITVAKKADSTYPIVSAASICAKVTRDVALKVWKFREGITVDSFGSGYPGDPVTKNFLRNHIDPVFGYPRLVRFSWSTAANALKGNATDMQVDDDDEERDLTYTGTTMTTFYKSSKNPNVSRKRHIYFQQRFLNNATDL